MSGEWLHSSLRDERLRRHSVDSGCGRAAHAAPTSSDGSLPSREAAATMHVRLVGQSNTCGKQGYPCLGIHRRASRAVHTGDFDATVTLTACAPIM